MNWMAEVINQIPLSALVGGMLIGLGAVFFYLSVGRIAGISGIFFGINFKKAEIWRIFFIVGLLLGAYFAVIINPDIAIVKDETPTPILILAGLLIGFGSRMGNGCTSGHGVCGLGRRSKRSIVAVACFMMSGFIAATFIRHMLGV